MMLARFFSALLLTFVLFPSSDSFAEASSSHHPRVLKFSGVPVSEAASIKAKFPYVFEREVTLSEVDQIVQWLMKTGHYSNVEVVERTSASGNRELVLQASILRHIKSITVTGNHVFSATEIKKDLDISESQTFERKELLAAAEELNKKYQRAGYHNARVEIDFKTPSDAEVDIAVDVVEGAPLKVTDLIVDTPNEELNSHLKRLSKRLKGQPLNANSLTDFEKSVTTYLQTNRYLIAKLSTPSIVYNDGRTEAKISYSIDNPWRYEFFFTGNKSFTDGSLIDHFDLDKFTGSVSTPAPDLAEKIRRLYQNAGYANIEVTYLEKSFETDYIRRIQFSIDEGPRVRIKSISVSGNISRPENYYASFIRSSSSDLIGDGYYNRKDLEEGGKTLITELQNQGYLKAKILVQRAEMAKDKKSVSIQIQIDEGPLTQIRQIRFDGAETVTRTELLDLLKIKTGAALSLKDLEESIKALKEYYHNRGYLEMKILNENEQDRIVTYNDTSTQATVVFQIQEGPKVTVGKIVIEGNTFTKSSVIEREIRFKEGDVLTPQKIDETVYNLQRLGLFSRVEIRMAEEDTPIAARTIEIKVGERDPGLFVVGFGVNNDNTTSLNINYRGYLGIGYRNLAGTGRALSLRADANYISDPSIKYLENRQTLSYLEPFILDTITRLRVTLVREQQAPYLFVTVGDAQHAEIIEANTVSFLFERDIVRHIKLSFTAYSFSAQRTFDRTNYQTINTVDIAKFGPLFEFDYRDDAFNPTKGSYSSLDLQYADPLLGSTRTPEETVQFFKSNAGVTVYTPLVRSHRIVLADSIHGGYLSNLSHAVNSGVPVQEAFFLGGRSTVRGFDGSANSRIPTQNELGGFDNPTFNLANFKVTADSYYYLLKSELRFPIWRDSFAGDLGGALFYDGGAVLINQPGLQIVEAYRDAIGVGLRIATPVGPASFDYGFKLNRLRGEAPGAFHFSIGVF